MGNFYVNYTIRDVTQVELAAVMAGRRAIVSPESNGEVVVFDKASDRQDQKQITWLGAKLSGDLRRAVLRVLNHDDDILWYQLHIAGALADEYDSCLDYFDFDGVGEMSGPKGGDAAVLCRTFESEQVEYVEQVLRKPGLEYVFEFQRHADLFEALNLPDFSVGNSYASFGSGGRGEGMPAGEIIRTS